MKIVNKGQLIYRNIYFEFMPFILQKVIWKLVKRKNLNYFKQLVEDPDSHWNKYNCIFVHIPKCAGVSLATALFTTPQVPAHLKLFNYKVLLPSDIYASSFKFAFVRNPWDRLVSAYEYFKKGGRVPHDLQWAENVLYCYKDFDEFVREWIQEENVWKKEHFAPQASFICLKRKLNIDFVGRYESIAFDYERLVNKLGFGRSLPFLNKTEGRRDYRTYYTDKTAAIVERVYSSDIDLLGYTFE